MSFSKSDKQYLQLCDDNIEWISMKGMPNGGTYVGKSAVFDDYFPNLFSNFVEFHAVAEQFLDIGNTVLVTGRYQGLAKSRKRFDVPFAHIYSIKDNLIRSYAVAPI